MIGLNKYIEINEKKIVGNIVLPPESIVDKFYTKCFNKDYRNKCNSSLTGARTRHQLELMRGFFGDDQKTIIKNVNKLLQKYFNIPEDSYELTFMIKDPDGGSGLYPSVHIDFNKDFYSDIMKVSKGEHVCITCISSNVVRKKSVTPDSLGLADGITYYKSVEEIVERLKKSSFFKLTSSHKVQISIMMNLIEAIIKSDSGKKYKSFIELAQNENYSRELGDIIKNSKLRKGEFNNILNDFGEVIGPCFILSKLEGKHTLFYPKESNNPLYDYIIDNNTATQVYVSAKANQGANPTSTVMARNIYELTHILSQTPNQEISGCNPFFVSRIIPILAGAPLGTSHKDGKYNYMKKGYIAWIHISLIEALASQDDKPSKEAIELMKEYGIEYDKKTKAISDDSLVALKKNDKLKEFLTKLYDILDYKPSSKYSIDIINDKEFMKNKNLRQGCIRYPIASYCCRVINEKYGKDISVCCQIALGAYQIYLVDKNNERLDIIIKNMSAKSQKYTLQPGSLVSNPDNCSIKIHLVK